MNLETENPAQLTPRDREILRDRIVHIESHVPHDPEGPLITYEPDSEADLILEVPAGTADRYGWRVGDPVGFDPPIRSGRE